MNARSRLVTAAASLAVVVGSVAAPAPSLAKGKAKLPPPQTGLFQMETPPPFPYIYMAVPKDYDASRFYPLLYVLHPSQGKPDDFVTAWSGTMLAKGWIVAGPYSSEWNYDTTLDPLKAALAKVQEVYHIDDKRIVIAGHDAGANMAWRLATQWPDPFASIVAFSGEIPSQDHPNLKRLVGKRVYIFRGARETAYTPSMLETDRKLLVTNKIEPTIEVKPDWGLDFPLASMPVITKWIDDTWPPGTYREKAAAVEEALKGKDVQAIEAALAALAADLKKNPYPAFESRVAGYTQAVLAIGRTMIADAKNLVGVDPLKALDAAEAAVKALRGVKPVDAEAVAARTAIQKDPAVVEALRKKQAEASAAQYLDKAAAFEAKGDLAKALEYYKKVVALGDSSKKAEAEAKVKELQPKVGGG